MVNGIAVGNFTKTNLCLVSIAFVMMAIGLPSIVTNFGFLSVIDFLSL
jgi:hypothetical protein